MTHSVGSLTWSETTDGRLGVRDRLHLVGQIMRAEWRERRPFAGPPISKAWLDELVLPDSRICQLAEEEAKDTLTEVIVGHCRRTYAFGALLARQNGWRLDPEMLFVSSLLHDLGMCEEHYSRGCFAVIGAQMAQAFLAENGYGEVPSRQVAEAISLHLNPVIDPVFGGEAQALQAGAYLDVAGMGRRRFTTECLNAINARYPRKDFKTEFLRHIRCDHAKGTRARFMKGIGFDRRLESSPL